MDDEGVIEGAGGGEEGGAPRQRPWEETQPHFVMGAGRGGPQHLVEAAVG